MLKYCRSCNVIETHLVPAVFVSPHPAGVVLNAPVMVRSEEHHSWRQYSRAVGKSAPNLHSGQGFVQSVHSVVELQDFECGRHRHWWHGEEKSDQEQTPLFWIKMWSNDLLELARGFSSWAQMNWHLRSFSYFCLCFPTKLSTLNVTALQRWCHYRHTRLRPKLQMWAQHTQTSHFYLNRVCLLLLQLASCFIFIIKIAASVVSV